MSEPVASYSDEVSPTLREIAERPGPRVERLVADGRTIWIKRPGETQATGWHRLQRLIAALAPHPMLRVTVDTGGAASLAREHERIERFAQAGFLVPPVLLRTERALVLGDLGEDLGRQLKRDREAFGQLLPLVGETLGRAHAAGLAHGRPSRRDLVVQDGTIGFLDFEEDPAAVMPLAAAQARDVWLLFIDLARADLPRAALDRCLSGYAPHLGTERRDALRGPVRLVANAAKVLQPMTAPFAGRDLRAPMVAARFLRAALDL